MKAILASASLAALLAAAPAYAQVFKCVDANGKTVYSQSPCASGSKSTVLERTPPPPAPAPSAKAAGKDAKDAKDGKPQTNADLEMEYRKRQKEREDADKKAAQELAQTKEAAEACTRAKQTLSMYEMTGRASRIDASGERVFLNDQEFSAEKAKAAELVRINCK